MKRRLGPRGVLGLALLGVPHVLSAQEAAAPTPAPDVLCVTVEGVQPAAGGVLLVRLYTQEKDWLHQGRAVAELKVPPAPTVEVQFPGVKPGPVAVSVLHDENQNGRLDMRWFPWPRPAEGAGASRDPRPRFGPPSFSDAVFEFRPSQPVTVRVFYMD